MHSVCYEYRVDLNLNKFSSNQIVIGYVENFKFDFYINCVELSLSENESKMNIRLAILFLCEGCISSQIMKWCYN